MKVKRIRPGVYKVTHTSGTWIVRGGKSYNPTWSGIWDIWVTNDPEQCTDSNCLALGFPTKRHCINLIKSWL
jgi:hypothetical protein